MLDIEVGSVRGGGDCTAQRTNTDTGYVITDNAKMFWANELGWVTFSKCTSTDDAGWFRSTYRLYKYQ